MQSWQPTLSNRYCQKFHQMPFCWGGRALDNQYVSKTMSVPLPKAALELLVSTMNNQVWDQEKQYSCGDGAMPKLANLTAQCKWWGYMELCTSVAILVLARNFLKACMNNSAVLHCLWSLNSCFCKIKVFRNKIFVLLPIFSHYKYHLECWNVC